VNIFILLTKEIMCDDSRVVIELKQEDEERGGYPFFL